MSKTNEKGEPLRFAHNPKINKVCAPVLQMEFGAHHGVAHRFPTDLWTLEMSQEIVVEEFNSAEEMELFLKEFELTLDRNEHLHSAYSDSIAPSLREH